MMPKKLKCDCNQATCQTCSHREYMRKVRAEHKFLREIIWPTKDWASSARAEAEQLTRYVCPLLAAVRNAEGLIRHSRELRMAVGMAVMTADELMETDSIQ